ncbi:MAG: hypothetical protein HY813_00860 [Candidatus Portnoybacteria bacterium]|nr:hypothetical protein [Candidatus Portnoybacteria bacterium]
MKKTRLLESLGFDEKTEKVYRALLSLADAPASQIAREVSFKRTSVYHILEYLASIGLASSYTSRGTRRYFAESPVKLKSFFEQKMILAQRLIPLLQKDIDQSRGKAVLRIFEGIKGITSISEESLEAKEKTIFSIGSSTEFLKFVGGKQGYGERRRKKGIFVRALRFEEDRPEVGSGHLHEVRILPEGLKFPGLILVFDKKVGIILFEGNGLGFVVESEAFSRMVKSIFEWLWDKAIPHRQN